MIKLYTWPTPNGLKIPIALEELALPYTVVPVDITKGEQLEPAFLAINPNHRIPAIVDDEPAGGGVLTLFESGAILTYLGEKSGRLLAKEGTARYVAMQWLAFQVSAVGPMFGQYGHFSTYAEEKIPYAIDRYRNEVKRIYRVLERRLADSAYLAGPEYSIADIATFTWARHPHLREVDVETLPSTNRWLAAIEARPAVQRGLAVLKEHQRSGPMTAAERDVLFGATQHAALGK